MIRLEDVVLLVSSDQVKTDLEITCLVCGEHLADAETGDTMQVLHGLAVDHLATHDDPALDAVRDMPDPRDDALDQIAHLWAETRAGNESAVLRAIVTLLRQTGRLV